MKSVDFYYKKCIPQKLFSLVDKKKEKLFFLDNGKLIFKYQYVRNLDRNTYSLTSNLANKIQIFELIKRFNFTSFGILKEYGYNIQNRIFT